MSTINGKVCVVNGTPVDKVLSNGKQVYGRNLALGTATPFKTTGGGINKMYSTSKTLPSGTTVTVAYDITSTKSEGTYTSQFMWGSWQGSTVLPLTAGTQHESYTIVTNADYSSGIQMVIKNSTATVTVSNLIISTTPSPWTPAPEDVLN